MLKARHILVASGARSVPLLFSGAEHAITSDAFMELEQLSVTCFRKSHDP